MREIKIRYIFRNEETGKLIKKIFTIEELEKGIKLPLFHDIYFNKKWTIEARNLYIELKDKNGKDIYEKDVVKIDEYTGYYIVKYENGAYKLHHYKNEAWWHWLHTHSIFRDRVKDIEVIGNVYEHKHLLEDDEK